MKNRLYVVFAPGPDRRKPELAVCTYYYGRLDGRHGSCVLLDRALTITGHPQEHMIQVVKALRRIEGADPGYKAARAVWDARTEICI